MNEWIKSLYCFFHKKTRPKGAFIYLKDQATESFKPLPALKLGTLLAGI